MGSHEPPWFPGLGSPPPGFLPGQSPKKPHAHTPGFPRFPPGLDEAWRLDEDFCGLPGQFVGEVSLNQDSQCATPACIACRRQNCGGGN